MQTDVTTTAYHTISDRLGTGIEFRVPNEDVEVHEREKTGQYVSVEARVEGTDEWVDAELRRVEPTASSDGLYALWFDDALDVESWVADFRVTSIGAIEVSEKVGDEIFEYAGEQPLHELKEEAELDWFITELRANYEHHEDVREAVHELVDETDG